MLLQEQNKLIDDLIKENPDATVRDFLLLKNDLEAIAAEAEKTFKNQPYIFGLDFKRP